MTHFVYMNKEKKFKKKATFVRSGKVEMISTFKRNRHFRKMLVNKTFMHVQVEKKTMSPRHFAYIPPNGKSPLSLRYNIILKLRRFYPSQNFRFTLDDF